MAVTALLVNDVMVAPAREPLRSVLRPEGELTDVERRLTAVARMAETVTIGDVNDRHKVLEQVVEVRDRLDPRPVPRWACDLSVVFGTLE